MSVQDTTRPCPRCGTPAGQECVPSCPFSPGYAGALVVEPYERTALEEAEEQRDWAQQRLLIAVNKLRDRARKYQLDDGTEGRVGGWGWRDIAKALRETADELEADLARPASEDEKKEKKSSPSGDLRKQR